MEQLKKCPFCGSNITVTKGGFINAPFLFFKCTNQKCGAVVSFDNMTANREPEKARDNWNSRFVQKATHILERRKEGERNG